LELDPSQEFPATSLHVKSLVTEIEKSTKAHLGSKFKVFGTIILGDWIPPQKPCALVHGVRQLMGFSKQETWERPKNNSRDVHAVLEAFGEKNEHPLMTGVLRNGISRLMWEDAVLNAEQGFQHLLCACESKTLNRNEACVHERREIMCLIKEMCKDFDACDLLELIHDDEEASWQDLAMIQRSFRNRAIQCGFRSNSGSFQVK